MTDQAFMTDHPYGVVCGRPEHEGHDATRGSRPGEVLVFGIIAQGPKNIFYGGRDNLHLGGAVSPTADFRGLAGHHRELVSAEIGELGCPRHRRRPRPFRV